MRQLLIVLIAVVFVAAAEPQRKGRIGKGGRGRPTPSTSAVSCSTAGILCVPSEYATVQACSNAAVAGDTCYVSSGTYAEVVSIAGSGNSASDTITYLAAPGTPTVCGMTFAGKSYVRVIGFTLDTDAGGCTRSVRAVDPSGTSVGWEFWNNTFRDATHGIATGSYGDRQHNWIIIGNTFTALGGSGTCGTGVSIRGNNNFVAYNEIDGVDCDAFQVDGTGSVWANNYLHNVLDSGDNHADFFQSNGSTLGLSNNLFEANINVANGTLPNEHGVLVQNQLSGACLSGTGTCGAISENLYRRNVWHRGGVLGADGPDEGAIANLRQTNDTIVEAIRALTTQTYSVSVSGNGTTGRLMNTLFYHGWGSAVSSGLEVFLTGSSGVFTQANYNLAYPGTFTTPWTGQANPQTNVDPALVDVANDNFTLGSGSGARNTGGPLATTSGGGTGTTFNVAAGGGGWFRGPYTGIAAYGGTFTAGDEITVGADAVTVASVSTDAITVTGSFTWADGESVYLGSSTTPDIGAYPYKAGGYALSATCSRAGSAVTVTPNDASLVRFVVVYENGVPTTVDNSSPYTATVGSGVLTVRVYPRYASTTIYATATGC